MATPVRTLKNDTTYHIYNRGVEKRNIFMDGSDYRRFMSSILYYQQTNITQSYSQNHDANPTEEFNGPYNFTILAYCLMPNHFHLVVTQTIEDGIKTSLSALLNSYTKYFNKKNNRVGHLFQDRYKTQEVTTDEQLLHLVRYVLLNPYSSGIDNNSTYKWSAYKEYINPSSDIKICDHSWIPNYFPDRLTFLRFMQDYKDEARSRFIAQH